MDTTSNPSWVDTIINGFNNAATVVAQGSVDVNTIQSVTSSPSVPTPNPVPPQFAASTGLPALSMGTYTLIALGVALMLYKLVK